MNINEPTLHKSQGTDLWDVGVFPAGRQLWQHVLRQGLIVPWRSEMCSEAGPGTFGGGA